MDENTPQLSDEQESELQTEMGLSKDAFKAIKKKIKKMGGRDDKAFMDMLRSVNRNHYILNQMVDRKARIMLSVNALIISIIIGKVIVGHDLYDWNYFLLLFLGITCFISIVFSMMAVRPEKSHGKLNEELIMRKEGNPLFFGNFKDMKEEVYVSSMMQMVNDRDFIYRSMIQDIYHLGLILENKRKNLRNALHVFIIGLCCSLLLSFLLSYFLSAD